MAVNFLFWFSNILAISHLLYNLFFVFGYFVLTVAEKYGGIDDFLVETMIRLGIPIEESISAISSVMPTASTGRHWSQKRETSYP